MEFINNLLSRESEEEPVEQTVSRFYDDTDLEFADTESLISGSTVPSKNARRALERYVKDGGVALEDFAYALEEASKVWEDYLENDDHNPRPISERQANAFAAGGAGPGFTSNAPAYSKEVEESVEEYRSEVESQLGENYDNLTASQLTESLISPEEKAEAVLKTEYGIENPEEEL